MDDAGPLHVAVGSHQFGVLSPERITAVLKTAERATCCVPRGGILLMRPLLLHSSHPARIAKHRRVVHFELAASALPEPARWHLDQPL